MIAIKGNIYTCQKFYQLPVYSVVTVTFPSDELSVVSLLFFHLRVPYHYTPKSNVSTQGEVTRERRS